MGHYEHWREDLALARALGVQALRWGVPWYRVEPLPGEFDWRWTDQVLPYLVEELGITPIIDLMHYGCPFWLRREFASAEYPRAVASYAAAFARRYRQLVKWYTPLNEPLVNALMCGKRGLWPPYLRGDGGYIQIMLQLAAGILNTVEAIKEVDPDALMVHVEATGLSRAAREDLEALAMEEQRRGFLCYDLLTGWVTPDHPLFSWLVRNGAGPNDLAALARRRITLDVMGLNFYPQWSTQQLYLDARGRLASRPVEKDGSGFATLIDDYYQRYGAPIIVTETSARGSTQVRAHWLESSLAAIKGLRERGVPVLGYTWFPMCTMIEWRYRFGREPLEAYRLELGLYTLSDNGSGARWRATPLVEQWRRYVRNPADAIGAVVGSQ
jgi:beta-glucosidase/6-phospho-beta-glucosidase/beta-galactosidase